MLTAARNAARTHFSRQVLIDNPWLLRAQSCVNAHLIASGDSIRCVHRKWSETAELGALTGIILGIAPLAKGALAHAPATRVGRGEVRRRSVLQALAMLRKLAE